MTFSVTDIDIRLVDSIIDRAHANPELLIGILQDIQGEFKYLPKPALARISEKLNVPLNRVWAVATFYEAFTLEPRGRIHIMVCEGTACHVKKASELVRTLEEELNIKPGHTTPDGEISFETAHCLGACALSPVVVIGDEYHGHVGKTVLLALLKKYRESNGGGKK